jgi:excisionase family DNA binding protein
VQSPAGDPVRQAARALILGLAEQSRRDGGLKPSPGLTRELERLMAEAGHAPGTMEASHPQECWLTVDQAARLTRTSARTVRRLVSSGRLIGRRFGWAWQVEKTSAMDYGKDRARGR